ncbi:MAG: hypothetical protein ACOYM8_10725 [Caulobacterales bacterium]
MKTGHICLVQVMFARDIRPVFGCGYSMAVDQVGGRARKVGAEPARNRGFVVLDALFAVVVASLAVAICLETLRLGRGFGKRAEEQRRAAAELEIAMLLDARPGVKSYTVVRGFERRVSVIEEAYRGRKVCRVRVDVQGGGDRRTYSVEGVRWCSRPPT